MNNLISAAVQALVNLGRNPQLQREPTDAKNHASDMSPLDANSYHPLQTRTGHDLDPHESNNIANSTDHTNPEPNQTSTTATKPLVVVGNTTLVNLLESCQQQTTLPYKFSLDSIDKESPLRWYAQRMIFTPATDTTAPSVDTAAHLDNAYNELNPNGEPPARHKHLLACARLEGSIQSLRQLGTNEFSIVLWYKPQTFKKVGLHRRKRRHFRDREWTKFTFVITQSELESILHPAGCYIVNEISARLMEDDGSTYPVFNRILRNLYRSYWRGSFVSFCATRNHNLFIGMSPKGKQTPILSSWVLNAPDVDNRHDAEQAGAQWGMEYDIDDKTTGIDFVAHKPHLINTSDIQDGWMPNGCALSTGDRDKLISNRANNIFHDVKIKAGCSNGEHPEELQLSFCNPLSNIPYPLSVGSQPGSHMCVGYGLLNAMAFSNYFDTSVLQNFHTKLVDLASTTTGGGNFESHLHAIVESTVPGYQLVGSKKKRNVKFKPLDSAHDQTRLIVATPIVDPRSDTHPHAISFFGGKIIDSARPHLAIITKHNLDAICGGRDYYRGLKHLKELRRRTHPSPPPNQRLDTHSRQAETDRLSK